MYRIAIHSKVESEAAQKHAFKLGFSWDTPWPNAAIIELPERALFIDPTSKHLQCSMPGRGYENIPLDEFLEMDSLDWPSVPNSTGRFVFTCDPLGVRVWRPSELEDGIMPDVRFDTSDQADKFLRHFKLIMDYHQVLNYFELPANLRIITMKVDDPTKAKAVEAAMRARGW